ncbi:hypothetical protein D3C80_1054340 [compost metagenome]
MKFDLFDSYCALMLSSAIPSISLWVSGLRAVIIYSRVVGHGLPLACTLNDAAMVSPGLYFGWMPCSASSGDAVFLNSSVRLRVFSSTALPFASLTTFPLLSSLTKFSPLSSVSCTSILECSMLKAARFSTSAVISKIPSSL